MPPIALRLHRASPAERAAYAQHRRALAAWHARTADAYARWIDGEIEPPEPPAILASIISPSRALRMGDNAAEAWRAALESGR